MNIALHAMGRRLGGGSPPEAPGACPSRRSTKAPPSSGFLYVEFFVLQGDGFNMKPINLLLLLVIGSFAQIKPMNLIFYGDSLTEGVPHINGETDTYTFQVGQNYAGSTYVKLGYRGQTTVFLREHLDSFLVTLHKTDYWNVLVLWGGTNDCAQDRAACGQVYSNLVLISQAAHAAGWQVVILTVIDRDNYFSGTDHATFEYDVELLNQLIRSSTAFDAVADVAIALNNADDPSYYWDKCHLLRQGYSLVARLVIQAIDSLQGPTHVQAFSRH